MRTYDFRTCHRVVFKKLGFLFRIALWIKWPCGVCKNKCTKNQDYILSGSCCQWFYRHCEELNWAQFTELGYFEHGSIVNRHTASYSITQCIPLSADCDIAFRTLTCTMTPLRLTATEMSQETLYIMNGNSNHDAIRTPIHFVLLLKVESDSATVSLCEVDTSETMLSELADQLKLIPSTREQLLAMATV